MARTDAQFNHRVPAALKKAFDEEAKAHGRSSTQHLIYILNHRNNVLSAIEGLEQFARNQEIFNDAVMKALKPDIPRPPAKKIVVLMNTRILDDKLGLHLSKRVTRVLADDINGIYTVRDLTEMTTQRASKLVGIGDKAMEEINSFMLRNGFKYINH